MSRKLTIFLAISIGWASLIGAGLFLTDTPLDSLAGVLALAVLYMPSPFVAAVIAEGGIRRDRFRLPRGAAHTLGFLLIPIASVFAFVLLYLGAVFVGGDLLGIPGIGRLATTEAEIMAGAAGLLSQDAVEAAGSPPPMIVLVLASMWGAALAGWTINGLFALGEEYGWRGLMWDELKNTGAVRANLTIGAAWGIWHAPLILQGYNYGSPLLGVPAMVLFCIAMSFLLTAIRERTRSVLPVAAAHGIFNALVPIVFILAPNTNTILAGPLGALGSVLLLLIGAAFWAATRRPATTAAKETAAVSASGMSHLGR